MSKRGRNKSPAKSSLGLPQKNLPSSNTVEQIPADILNNLPPQVREMLQNGGRFTAEYSKTSVFQSNFPPAEWFEAYEHSFPGWGMKLLELTEMQVNHRHKLEAKQVDRSERRMDVGQYGTFGLGILSLIVALLIQIYGPSSWATSIAALGVVVVGIGGPSVARIIATKFRWPTLRDKPPQ
jgi:uncharacterized membrane protein